MNGRETTKSQENVVSLRENSRETTLSLNKDVLTDKQCCEDPHRDGDVLELAGNSVAENVGDNTEKDTVGDTVSERHHDDGDECGDGPAVVLPVDALHGAHHHYTHDDKGGSGSCAGDREEDRAEEESKGEAHCG